MFYLQEMLMMKCVEKWARSVRCAGQVFSRQERRENNSNSAKNKQELDECAVTTALILTCCAKLLGVWKFDDFEHANYFENSHGGR